MTFVKLNVKDTVLVKSANITGRVFSIDRDNNTAEVVYTTVYDESDSVVETKSEFPLFELTKIDVNTKFLNGSSQQIKKLLNNPLQIKIKYFNKDMTKLSKITQGDWIDLRAAETVELKAGEFKLIPLGVAMELPEEYEAHVAPRGSTFKNYGVIETNSVGVVDESYKGDNDQWFMPVLAMRDTVIPFDERICQFRIIEKMPEVEFVEVEVLGNVDRGSHGSTGVK